MRRKIVFTIIIISIILLVAVVVIKVNVDIMKSHTYSVYITTEECTGREPIGPFGLNNVYTIPKNTYIRRGHDIIDINPTSPYSNEYYFYYGDHHIIIEKSVIDTFKYCGEITEFDYKYGNWQKKIAES